MSITNNVVSKVNKYIFSEDVKKQHDEYVKNNGTLIRKIRTPFGTNKLYCVLL